MHSCPRYGLLVFRLSGDWASRCRHSCASVDLRRKCRQTQAPDSRSRAARHHAGRRHRETHLFHSGCLKRSEAVAWNAGDRSAFGRGIAAGDGAGRGARSPPPPPRHAESFVAGRADADHPRDHRRRGHDRRRHQPRTSLRRCRRRGPRAISSQNRRPEGCRSDADDARCRAGLRYRRIRPGDFRDGISDGRALGHRVVRAQRAAAVHSRNQSEGSGQTCSRKSRRCFGAAVSDTSCANRSPRSSPTWWRCQWR